MKHRLALALAAAAGGALALIVTAMFTSGRAELMTEQQCYSEAAGLDRKLRNEEQLLKQAQRWAEQAANPDYLKRELQRYTAAIDYLKGEVERHEANCLTSAERARRARATP